MSNHMHLWSFSKYSYSFCTIILFLPRVLYFASSLLLPIYPHTPQGPKRSHATPQSTHCYPSPSLSPPESPTVSTTSDHPHHNRLTSSTHRTLISYLFKGAIYSVVEKLNAPLLPPQCTVHTKKYLQPHDTIIRGRLCGTVWRNQ